MCAIAFTPFASLHLPIPINQSTNQTGHHRTIKNVFEPFRVSAGNHSPATREDHNVIVTISQAVLIVDPSNGVTVDTVDAENFTEREDRFH
jgi:hypothetical protein